MCKLLKYSLTVATIYILIKAVKPEVNVFYTVNNWNEGAIDESKAS